jgi:ribosomal protein S18 acetylase RimI-like enzyme
MMPVTAGTVSRLALLDAFNAAFADYVIPMPALDAAGFEAFLLRQGVDLEASRVVTDGPVVLAFALVGRRSTSARLATMGARPEARGTGAAPALLDRMIEDARARGDASVELEVFAQNPRALALYRGRGFEVVDELLGFDAPLAVAPTRGSLPTEVSLDDAVTFLRGFADAELPFQVSADAVAVAPPGTKAWRVGTAQLVFRETAPGSVSILSLVVPEEPRARGAARELLRALREAHQGALIGAPQLQRRATVAPVFEAEGWARRELHQLWMRLAFG